MRASGARAGWQQMKIRRSSSSWMVSAMAGPCSVSASAASSGKAPASRACRRQRSMVLKRPVETNQE